MGKGGRFGKYGEAKRLERLKGKKVSLPRTREERRKVQGGKTRKRPSGGAKG